MKKILLVFVLSLIIISGAYFAYTQYTYSEGVRAGLLVKFSKKGYIFKTYEGELNLGGVSQQNQTIMNNMWAFSIKDKRVAEKLMGKEGERVQLHYKEINKNFFFQGDTRYFVDSVVVID